MQGAFIQSLTYRPPSLLGRQLLPFSPWHGLILESAASPYICVGIPQIDDLIFGIWVCSHDYNEGYKVVSDVSAVHKWGKKTKHINFADEMVVFKEYIEASFRTPKYWQKTGDDNKIRATYWWHCATFAMRELHLTEAQAWNYSIAKITCHQACVAEINGNKDLITEDQFPPETSIDDLAKENK